MCVHKATHHKGEVIWRFVVSAPVRKSLNKVKTFLSVDYSKAVLKRNSNRQLG